MRRLFAAPVADAEKLLDRCLSVAVSFSLATWPTNLPTTRHSTSPPPRILPSRTSSPRLRSRFVHGTADPQQADPCMQLHDDAFMLVTRVIVTTWIGCSRTRTVGAQSVLNTRMSVAVRELQCSSCAVNRPLGLRVMWLWCGLWLGFIGFVMFMIRVRMLGWGSGYWVRI